MPFLKKDVLLFRSLRHLPHQDLFLQTISWRKRKHLVWTTLKYNLPTRLELPKLLNFKHDRNLSGQTTQSQWIRISVDCVVWIMPCAIFWIMWCNCNRRKKEVKGSFADLDYKESNFSKGMLWGE